MQCVICKRGEVRLATVEAEIKIGNDHLLVPVQAQCCAECGEAYYAPETLRYLERVRADFIEHLISPTAIGHVYQLPEPVTS